MLAGFAVAERGGGVRGSRRVGEVVARVEFEVVRHQSRYAGDVVGETIAAYRVVVGRKTRDNYLPSKMKRRYDTSYIGFKNGVVL